MDCVRSIMFVIPGVDGGPDIQVTAVEVDGTIEFTLEVLPGDEGEVGDIRGLFFNLNDDSKLMNSSAFGVDVTDYQAGDVIDLGHGANMHGAADPYDAGVEFGGPGIGKTKGDVQLTSFTLSNEAGDLTLDDIAQVEFGVRVTSIGAPGGGRGGSAKMVTLAPAAPDAVDDSYSIFEDGASGLDDPSDTAVGVLFSVLDNDTDADGDTLTITDAFGAMHGTVQIVDGDDPDLLPGDALLYTPDTDYAGADSFTYCISDGNGGTDYATVNVWVEAVADVPEVSIIASATSNVHEVHLQVIATETDDDNSEFIASLVSSAVPFGVTLNTLGTVTTTDYVSRSYLLTLPDADFDFDLTFTATSQELSNGDTETGQATINIASAYDLTAGAIDFTATDQSIWDSGAAFVFDPDIPFLGLDVADSGNWGGDVLGGSWFYDIRVGLEQELLLEGGSVDVTVPYDVSVEAFYNLTTDVLQLDPTVALAGGGFMTDGPSLSYMLDLILEIAVGTSLEIAGFSAFSPSINENGSQSLIDYDSETSPPFEIGDSDDALSATLAWPELDVTGTSSGGGIFEGDGASNNVLQLNLDADQAIADLFFGGVNPFDLGIDFFSDFWETGVEAGIELLDLDLFAGLNFLQDFVLDAGDIVADIVFENGDTFEFNLAGATQYGNASQYDDNGDGMVEYELVFEAEGETFSNDTDLNINVGYSLALLEGFYRAGVLGAVAEGSFGPVYSTGAQADLVQFDVFSNEFALDLSSDSLDFAIG
ncbi:outer membrane adhesin-like protein [Citreicella sp. SE45]|nr:outer membrane adhesin-like protein [Citreicella sp. SE45]